jgi:poly(3-hydroxybutyrate) depolymerase
MLYHWYEWSHAAAWPGRVAAEMWLQFLHPLNPLTHTPLGRGAAAGWELFERATRRYDKPEFGIRTTKVGTRAVAVSEETVWTSPFCRVVHFKRDMCPTLSTSQPRLLLVAPMSGHFATLLRGTVEGFLPHHDVYITDWQDARHIPLSAGRFDLDDYIDAIIAIFRHFEGDLHVLAVCQPSVPVLAATALMEADGDPAVPRSLILAGGPIDTRVNPTAVNALAQDKGIQWFEQNVITTVPWPFEGFGRAVYPGFLQLSGFMSMNLDRHVRAYRDMYLHLVRGDGDSAAKHRKFYDEYLSVMDLTAAFYLQTIDSVFVRHLLPRGLMTSRGRAVDLSAIRRPALMTVEGEMDDITGKGQCGAALELCTGVPARRKSHFECPTVGHYGIFNGSRFRHEIAPRVSAFLRNHNQRAQPQAISRAGARFSELMARCARTRLSTGSPLEADVGANAA